MRAKAVDQLPEGPAGSYLYEPKWDGFRCIAMVTEDRGVHLQSRRGAHLNDLFPEVAWALHEYLPAATVVDGEIVRWAPDGRLDFTALQRRNMAGRRAEDLSLLAVSSVRDGRNIGRLFTFRDGVQLRRLGDLPMPGPAGPGIGGRPQRVAA